MATIFLSYSRKDTEIMRRVKETLEQAGISVWIDEHLKPGTPDWKRAIEYNLEQCKGVVVLLSPDSYKSIWVQRELSRADKLKRPIFPLLVRGTPSNAVPILLETVQFIDLRTNFYDGMISLVNEYQELGWRDLSREIEEEVFDRPSVRMQAGEPRPQPVQTQADRTSTDSIPYRIQHRSTWIGLMLFVVVVICGVIIWYLFRDEIEKMCATDTSIVTATLTNTFTPTTPTPATPTPTTPPPNPEADFQVTSEQRKGEAPHEVTFENLSLNATTWKWDFGDGYNSPDQNPTHVYTEPGKYTVTLTAFNEYGEEDTKIKTQYIDVLSPPPELKAEFEASLKNGEWPLTVNFEDKSSGSPSEWLWTFGDGNEPSKIQNPSHVYTKPGEYDVTLTIYNDWGASDFKTKQDFIIVYDHLEAAFDFTPPEGPAPLEVKFTDTSSGEPFYWKWDFGDGQYLEGDKSEYKNPTHVYQEAGEYDVTLTVIGLQGKSTTQKIPVVVSEGRAYGAASFIYIATGAYPISMSEPLDTSFGIPTNRYICGVVGIETSWGDFIERGVGDILKIYAYEKGTYWAVYADLRTEYSHEQWKNINILCADKNLVNNGTIIYKTLSDISGGDSKNTGIKKADYPYCTIFGMRAENGDIDEEDNRDTLLQARLVEGDSKWMLEVDFATEKEKQEEIWTVDVMCFKDEPAGLYQQPPSPLLYRSIELEPEMVKKDTSVSVDDYVCFVAGMEARDGEIEAGEVLYDPEIMPDILTVHLYDNASTNTWWVKADITTERNKSEEWTIQFLCITRIIVWD
jgi:PKD repeat protein